MNIDRLMDAIIEADECCRDYRHSSAVYRKINGHCLCLDYAKTDAEKHIRYAYYSDLRARDSIDLVVEVLEFNTEQSERLYSAARAIKKWYSLTRYERFLPESLQERIKNYIIG